jgi:hypothetical protein
MEESAHSPARDPTAPARLLTLADAAAQLADEARRALAWVSATVAQLDMLARVGALTAAEEAPAVAPAEPEPVRREPPPGARLLALEMAMAGGTREEVRSALTRVYDDVDPSGLLEEVFAPTSAASG